MALRWRNGFSCNIKEIDNQHKRLFEISSKLNILAPISSKINFNDEILEIIIELKDYAIYHFEYEEKMMQKFNYEDLEAHKLQHEAFINRVSELEQEQLQFSSIEMINSIIDYVTGWITAHILKTDMNYKDFFNGIGVY
ncbi:MAG: bacteriohemerythrin [Solirubrobacterales bacterium]